VHPEDWERIDQDDVLSIQDIRNTLKTGNRVTVINTSKNETYVTEHSLIQREIEMVLAGGLINLIRQKRH
jgi:aconitase A